MEPVLAPLPPPRLLLVTDGVGDVARLRGIVGAAIAGGVRAVQLREPSWSVRQLAAVALELQPLLRAVGGQLFVNDRVDVAAAGCCDGVQVGHRSLPPAAARLALAGRAGVGVPSHDPEELAAAAAAGADFALLSPVWTTASKPGHNGLGPARAGAWTADARLPVLWLGGVTAERIAAVRALPPQHRPVGFAVRGALCEAADVAAAAAALQDAVDRALDGAA
jgi:thiamine-phosphate pyrophosphorylase